MKRIHKRLFIQVLALTLVTIMLLGNLSVLGSENVKGSTEETNKFEDILSVDLQNEDIVEDSLVTLIGTDEIKTDRFIVKYKDTTTSALSATALQQKANANTNIKSARAMSHKKMGVYETKNKITAADLEKSLKANFVNGEIEYIQPDYEMETSNLTGTNSSETEQDNNDENIESVWDYSKTGIEEAQAVSTGAGVKIAVLDTGIDISHTKLQNKLDLENAWDFVNDDNSVDDEEYRAEQGHGTHVAGLIVADEVGVAPDAVVLPLKVFQNGKAYTSDIIEAIAYAENLGIKIVNCSWGNAYENPALYEAIEASDMLFVCAAGNSLMNLSEYPVYPACFDLPNILSVGSVDNNGRMSRFSNYSTEFVDIAAPGRMLSSTWQGNIMNEFSGTSTSAALVSGGAALVLGKNTSLSAVEIRNKILNSAAHISGLTDKVNEGHVVDFAYAVETHIFNNGLDYDVEDNEPIPTVTPSGTVWEEDAYETYGPEYSLSIKSSMNYPREALGVEAVNGKIYAIGGINNGVYSDKVEEYDPVTDTWTEKASMPTARAYFSTAEAHGKIYVLAGQESSTLTTVPTYVYDPATDSWETKGLSPTPLKSAAAVTWEVEISEIFITGGYTSASATASATNAVWSYNIEDDTWVQRGNLEKARAEHTAVNRSSSIFLNGGRAAANATTYINTEEYYTAYDGLSHNQNGISRTYGYNSSAVSLESRLWAMGGAVSNSTMYIDIAYQKELDSANNGGGFRAVPMSIGRTKMDSAICDGKLYIVGGRRSYYDDVTGMLEVIDLGIQEETVLDPYESTVDFETVEVNGKMYMLGGHSGGVVDEITGESTAYGSPSRAMYEYDDVEKVWIEKAEMPSPVIHPAVASAYGKIYTFGGTYASGSIRSEVYEWDMKTNTWQAKTSMNEAKYGASAVFFKGKIYVFGGITSDIPYEESNTAKEYDPITDTWTEKTPIPGESTIVNAQVINDKIYVFKDLNWNREICIYDPETDEWETIPNEFYAGDSMVTLNDEVYKFEPDTNSVYKYYYKNNSFGVYTTFQEYDEIISLCVVNNKIYIFGVEHVTSTTDVFSLTEYTPPVNPWVEQEGIGVKTAFAASAAIDETSDGITRPIIYTVGGLTADGVSRATRSYDTYAGYWNSTYWEPQPNLLTARQKLGVVALNGKLYAIGGATNSSGTATNAVEELTPGDETWISRSSNLPAMHSMATVAYGDSIYTFGGKKGTSSPYNYTYTNTPSANNTWTAKRAMPTARYGCGAAVIGDKIYVVGGFDGNDAALNTLEVYDPATNTWTTKTPMPDRRGYSGVVSSNGRLYVVGGFDGGYTMSTTHEYDPMSDSWKTWPGTPLPLYGSGVVAVNESIYSTGGLHSMDVNSSLSSDQVFFTPLTALYSDLIHLGEERVNPSGNLARKYTDMTMQSLGFELSVSRVYNSKDIRDDENVTPQFGNGWAFGFQGEITEMGTDVIVRLPNGSAMTFRRNSDGTYTARDSRNSLSENGETNYIFTTADQYKYIFSKETGYLTGIQDSKGNQINISHNANGQVTSVVNAVGIGFNFTLEDGKTTAITDSIGRTVSYEYDSNGRLCKSTDPSGYSVQYYYNDEGLLEAVKDAQGNTIESFTYYAEDEVFAGNIRTVTDKYGNTGTYTYDNIDISVTITDSNGKSSTTWFDRSLYPIRTVNAEGQETRMQYNQHEGMNRYGEAKYQMDEDGNYTYFDRDNRGNIIRTVNPDGGVKQYTYNDKNSLTSERDEEGKYTFYIYAADGVTLLKTVQPLDGISPYSENAEQSQYAITEYEYYTYEQSLDMCDGGVYGLVKSVTDPENRITTYQYDDKGNRSAVINPLQKATSYEYNSAGWLLKETSPLGRVTEYFYDNNGRQIKVTTPEKGAVRRVYNTNGTLAKEVGALQYDEALDEAEYGSAPNQNIIVNGTDNYTADAGIRYTYKDEVSGLLSQKKDARGFVTEYSYDIYGNVISETKPDGSVFLYEYDNISRLVNTSYKKKATSSAILLESYEYNGSVTVATKYLNDTETATTVEVRDWADRQQQITYADGSVETINYYLNGNVKEIITQSGGHSYMQYDGMNRLVNQWVQVGDNSYRYTGYEYDKSGLVLKEKQGRQLVEKYEIPDTADCVYTINTYRADSLVQQTTNSAGGKTEYAYNDDGQILLEDNYFSVEDYNRKEYTYNNRGLVEKEILHVQNADLYGEGTSGTSALETSYEYDAAGNISKKTAADGVSAAYTYTVDGLLLTSTTTGTEDNEIVDEFGLPAIYQIQTLEYNWQGLPLSGKDALGNITEYTYDSFGNTITVKNSEGNTELYAYDRANRLIAQVSRENYISGADISQMNRTEYEHDKMGRVVREIRKYKVDGEWIEETASAKVYDYSGNVVKALDGEGYADGEGSTPEQKMQSGIGTEYVYNYANELVKIKDPEAVSRGIAHTALYTYDGMGRKISETDADGYIRTYTYDDFGNVLTEHVQGIGTVRTSTYDILGRELTHTDGNNNSTIYTYNAFNQVRSITLPGDETIPALVANCKYDALGRLVYEINSMNAENLYTYDALGRMTATTQRKSDGSETISTSVGYDLHGNIRNETDANGNYTEHMYNGVHLLVWSEYMVGPDFKMTRYTYDKNGNQKTVTDWLENTSTFTYDPLGRVVEKKNADNVTVEKLEYNLNDAQTVSIDALENTTSFTYDKNGRQLSVTDAEGNVTRVEYDNRGNVSKQIDGNGNAQQMSYDALGRLTAVTAGGNQIAAYTYDALGNVLTQTNGNSETTEYQYNARGLPIKMTDAEGGEESYTYYADGNLAQSTDRNGVTTVYTYDIHGRLLSKTAGGKTISFTYDANGNQLTMTDSTGTTTQTYDEENRVTSKTTPGFGTSTYTYDNISNLTSGYVSMQSQDPEGNVVEKVYDKVGRLLRVNNGSDTVSYTYYDNGNMERVTYPDNAYTAYTYYSNNDLKTVQNVNSSGTTIEAYNYAYDGNRNQTTVLDGYGTTRYEYNALNQLAKETLYNGQITQYTYDGAGNRSTESVLASAASEPDVTTYSYDGRNLLTATVEEKTNGSEVHTEFYYDNNGNLYSKLKSELAPVSEETEASVGLLDSSTEMTLYEYDVWNNLVKSIQGEAVVENTYNGLGQRVQKASSTAEENKTTKYLYDGAQVALEVDADTEEATLNIHGHALVGRKTGDDRLNYLYNGHGDVTKIIGSNSAIMGSYYYDAFGNLLEDESSVANSYKYAGYQHDEENGLYYLNARFYDPEIARFIQEDTYRGNTADPLSLNLYTYCVNNPVKYYDPTGHDYYYVGNSTKVEAEYDQTYFWNGVAYDYIPEWMPVCYVDPDLCADSTHRHITISFSAPTDEWLNIDVGLILGLESITAESIKNAGAIWLGANGEAKRVIKPQEDITDKKTADEHLSDGALIYILRYYSPQYREQANLVIENKEAGGKAYNDAKDKVEKLRNAICDIKKLDKDGMVEGTVLDVPVYDQHIVPNGQGTNLCWATCAAMWIMYLLKNPDSADYDIGRYYEYERKGIWQMIEDIAKYIAKDHPYKINEIVQLNPDGTNKHNVPREWQSTHSVGISNITAQQEPDDKLLRIYEIESQIKESPFAVLYEGLDKDENGNVKKDELGNEMWRGHWVLGIGYAKVEYGSHPKFLVVSNDPWGGIQRIQKYEEFIGPYIGDKDLTSWAWTACQW